MAEPAGYPRHWEADVVLRDGGTAHLRPITPADADALQRFHVAQSPQSQYLRFFVPMARLSDRDLERFTHVDHHDRVALVALVGDDIIGVGRYDRVAPGQAEVAFAISDAHQGRGLGSVLLEHLTFAARERGIHRFVAEVLPQNQKMVAVFRDAGFVVSHGYEEGMVSLSFDIDPTDRSLAVMAAREHRAEALSLSTLLNPRSVVVVAEDLGETSVAGVVLRNVLAAGFAGPVSAVGPGLVQVEGVRSCTRVADVPRPVDLAVVVGRAQEVPDLVRDCAAVGARGVVVLSGGFAETGPQGAVRQRELVLLARALGMRVVGPNSFGMINTSPQVRLNASLAGDMPAAGGLGLFSQSGALAVAVLSSAARRGLGVSSFVSAGNRADVSGNDLMQYWEEDPATTVVGLYLESVGNPRKFSRIARRLSRTKPVVVVKSGVSGYGVPPGHAVRTTRAPREALDAMLRQAGVIRVENIHQLFDVVQVLVNQPLPMGERIGVVGNSSALAALVAEAALSWGLQLGTEPVSLLPEATPAQFRAALEEMYAQPTIDAVVACFMPPLATADTAVASALAEVAGSSPKTTVACFIGTRTVTHELEDPEQARVIPSFPTPEDAVRALAAVTRYAQWRRRDPGDRPVLDGCDARRARALVEDVLAQDPEHRTGFEAPAEVVTELLRCYGVSVLPSRTVRTPEEAVAAAEELGWPVVLKFADGHLRDRRDLAGLRVDIAGPAELAVDLAAMCADLDAAGEPVPPGGHAFVVQPSAAPGVPVVVRSMEDPLFGPIVSFGMAGDASELLGDVAHRIPPLTDVDVADLIRSVKAAPRLFGYRGTPLLDVTSLEDLVLRVSQLADDLPEVAELALHPVIVAQHGVVVIDAQARLSRTFERVDAGGRRALG